MRTLKNDDRDYEMLNLGYHDPGRAELRTAMQSPQRSIWAKVRDAHGLKIAR